MNTSEGKARRLVHDLSSFAVADHISHLAPLDNKTFGRAVNIRK